MIRILFIGKTKEKWLKEGIEEYLKRLKRFTKVEIIESNDIEKYMKGNYVVALDKDGKQLTSEELASVIKKNEIESKILFIIGNEEGLNKEIIKKSNLTISFGRITLTHEMARLILLEQIYRAYNILNNTPYHK